MSKAVSALNGQSYDGFVRVAEAGLNGMITLRGDLASAAFAAAVLTATGCALPAARQVVTVGDKSALWMSPDELLLLVPYAEAAPTVAALEASLAGEHALVADVSDARALFRVTGAKATEALCKLAPVDFATLLPGEVRRTRAAQVAAALWQSGEAEWSLICFRSVAGYVMGLLTASAQKGSEVIPA
jgi:sarcosine oxidase, subunit gamma